MTDKTCFDCELVGGYTREISVKVEGKGKLKGLTFYLCADHYLVRKKSGDFRFNNKMIRYD